MKALLSLLFLLLVGSCTGGYYYAKGKITTFMQENEHMVMLYQKSLVAKAELEKYKVFLEEKINNHQKELALLKDLSKQYQNEAAALLRKLEINEETLKKSQQALQKAEAALKLSEETLKERTEQVKALSNELSHLKDELTHNQEKRKILEEAFK